MKATGDQKMITRSGRRLLLRVVLPVVFVGFLMSVADSDPALGQEVPADPAAGLPQAGVEEAPVGAISPELPGEAAPGLGAERTELPASLSGDHFSVIRSQSPFLRTLNIADTYTLRGVAEIGGDPVATLYNKETKKTVTITRGQPNEAGIQMVEVVPARDLEGVAVKISFAGEVVELKYDAAVISPQSRAGGGQKKSGDGERKGPSAEERKRYESLGPEQKKKFHEYAKQTMQKYPNLSREERFNMIRGALSRLAEGRDIEVQATKDK